MATSKLLSGKTVIVSGAGPGLGSTIAGALSSEGANVVLGARTQSRLDEIAGGLEKAVGKETDIEIFDDCLALAELAASRFGTIDGLVNCAARYSVTGGIEDSDFAEWEAVLKTNLIGSMQMTRAALKWLKESRGSVVFIGSQTTYWPYLPQPAYDASKGGVLAASMGLAKELGPAGVRINSVVPTWIWGQAVQGYVAHSASERNMTPDEVVAEITQGIPLGEIPTEQDVADSVVFLLSNRSRMITGQALFVNGGEYLRH